MLGLGGIHKQENLCQQTAWARGLRGTFHTYRPRTYLEGWRAMPAVFQKALLSFGFPILTTQTLSEPQL